MFTRLCVCVCFYKCLGKQLYLRAIIPFCFIFSIYQPPPPLPPPPFSLSNTIYQSIHSSSLPTPNIFPTPSLAHSRFNIPTRFLHLYSTSLCPLDCLHSRSPSYTALLFLFLTFPFFPLPLILLFCTTFLIKCSPSLHYFYFVY